MDPPGETYPTVLVEGDQFHVYFRDNSLEAPEGNNFFRRIYNADGELLVDRAVAPDGPVIAAKRAPDLGLPEELTGRWRKVGRAFYIIPEWDRKHHGQPFYLVANENRHIRRDLKWTTANVDVVEDFVVTATDLVLLVTRRIEGPATNDWRTDLWLCHFEKHSGELLKELRIGVPSFIYSFPGTSNLLQHGSDVLFVWNEGGDQDRREILHLARYNLSAKTVHDRSLPFQSTWNTSISINAIGDTVCLAYHGISRELAVEFVPTAEGAQH